ncbi:aldehyde dehydrogenase family protein [Scytonema sp. NUACC26]|uniref:aldehyde dehydrogenase family protein n=1 Tax=Scytonema sp. NUACC26 TaxID=3140176 RepID=UPI0034DBC45C
MVTALKLENQVKIGPTNLLINNEWVESVSGKRFETINPATGETICSVAEADAADVDKAVRAARAAFNNGEWRKMSVTRRGELLYKLADLIEQNKEELARLETLDNGKPLSESMNADLPLVIIRLSKSSIRPRFRANRACLNSACTVASLVKAVSTNSCMACG